MVSIFVRGVRVAAISDTASLTRLLEAGEPFEFRNDADRTLGRFHPDVRTIPALPVPTLTREELDRIDAKGGIPFEEVKKLLGWP